MKSKRKKIEGYRLVFDAIAHVRKAMRHYGVEGTEDAIKRAYSAMPKLRKYMLQTYKEVIHNEDMGI
jgi:hypothetical protein